MSSTFPARDGLLTMPRTIQCPQCGVVLNVPEAAAGRRLKCPKCATKFAADGGPPPSASSSTLPNRGLASSVTLPAAPLSELDLPVASGSLREQFDLPLLGEDPIPSRPASEADPLGLLGDEPVVRRRPTAAEGRAQARRCPTCGGVVPRGMSLCSTCGLDLETGRRIDLTEDIGPPAPLRRSAPPIGAWVVGGLSIFVSVLFAIISLVQAQGEGQWGYWCLLLVCVFGIFASVQFLRGRSIKLLFVALTMGVMVDILAMIILPVFMAVSNVEVNHQDADGPAIRSATEGLDTQKISWGIAIVVSYVAVALYLNSARVRRRFH
jgi:hypothetical protein